jgi:hypothetical protein
MKEDKDIREELSSLTPDFFWPEKMPAYHVPAGYFNNFPQKVMDQIHGKEARLSLEKQSSKVRQGVFLWKKLAIASCVAIVIVFGGVVWQHLHQQKVMEKQLASISNNAIETYLNIQSGLFDGAPIYNISNISDKDLKTLIKEVSKTEFIRK